MKPPQLGLAIAALLAATGVSNAVLITANTRTLSTTVGGTLVTTVPTQSQAISNNGTINGTANALNPTDLGGGSWEFNGLNLASIVEQRANTGSNTSVSVAGTFSYTISFTLGVTETATVYFDLGYTLNELGQSGSLSWSLTGGGISGAIGTGSPDSFITQTVTQQQASIGNGDYTFTLTGSMPSQATTRNQSITVAVDSFNLEIVAVPEPSVAVLGISGLGLLLFRRRRKHV